MHFRANHRLSAGIVAFVTATSSASAQSKPLPLKHKPEPTTAAITPADLMTRLYIFADDSMMGRAAATIYNDKSTDYIAGELKKMGIQPGGDSGTYFQQLPLVNLRLSTTKPLTIDGHQYFGGKDFIARQPHAFTGEQVVYGGLFGPDTSLMISPDSVAGKIVVLRTPIGPNGKPTWNNMRQPVNRRFGRANAVWLVGMDGMTPADMEPLFDNIGSLIITPGQPENVNFPFGFGYITGATAEALMGAPMAGMKIGTLGRTLQGAGTFDSLKAPARNVIGIIQGSDPKLRGQYVAIGAHNDHIGFQKGAVDHDSVKAFNDVALPEGADSLPRAMTPAMMAEFQRLLADMRKDHPARLDSIFNGADDDGSGTVSALEIAEYFQKSATKPKRSLIFVFHTGEELGLLGSTYFTDHPTISRDSIVTQLNMDMVGRGASTDVTGKMETTSAAGRVVLGDEIHGGPDYLQLVGSRRLATELGDLIEEVNKTQKRPLKFDYAIDADRHPSNIYCRSDHYSYARYGIPITFFTTGGHSDYHQLTDEPEYIDYEHMARVANLVKDIATRVANLDHRIVVNKPKPDPRGRCVQ